MKETKGLNITAIQKLLKIGKHKRPILDCISYQRYNIIFTNSYSLGILYNDKTNDNTFNYNVFNGMINNNEYPNIDKIIPNNFYKIEKMGLVGINQSDDLALIINDNDEYIFDYNLVNNTMNCFNDIKSIKGIKNILHLFSIHNDYFYINDRKTTLIYDNKELNIKFIVLGMKGVNNE